MGATLFLIPLPPRLYVRLIYQYYRRAYGPHAARRQSVPKCPRSFATQHYPNMRGVGNLVTLARTVQEARCNSQCRCQKAPSIRQAVPLNRSPLRRMSGPFQSQIKTILIAQDTVISSVPLDPVWIPFGGKGGCGHRMASPSPARLSSVRFTPRQETKITWRGLVGSRLLSHIIYEILFTYL